MFNIIPLVLIVISLLVIIFLVVRKFSVLANLDLNTIQSEREEKIKKRIIESRIKRNFMKHYMKMMRMTKPIKEIVAGFIKSQHDKLLDAKEEYKSKKSVEMPENKIDKLFLEFEDLEKNEDIDGAEKKLIEIIGIDGKNIKAFRELGNLYFDRKDYNEAKQTFEHVIRLFEKEEVDAANSVKLSDIYFDLASVLRAMEDLDNVIVNLDKSLALEPNNPRYLDTKLEISIMNKDKDLALETYNKLKEVNPENQKLEELKKQIEEI